MSKSFTDLVRQMNALEEARNKPVRRNVKGNLIADPRAKKPFPKHRFHDRRTFTNEGLHNISQLTSPEKKEDAEAAKSILDWRNAIGKRS